MNRTPIEWCRTYVEDGSFEEGFSVNPVRFRPKGAARLVTMCQKVSPGCTHCYAKGITRRFWPKDADQPFPGYTALGVVSGEFVLDERTLLSVLRRKKPARIFWGDMTDLFQESVPDAFLDRCFAVCALTPHLTHMFLTKRPERMYSYFGRSTDILNQVRAAMIGMQVSAIHLERTGCPVSEWSGLPMPNVWLGTSVENQAYADTRIPLLLQTPAAVRFISAEPLLETIDLENLPSHSGIGRHLDSLSNAGCEEADIPSMLDWVIVGGESGPGARPMHPDWARSLRDQCKDAKMAFFFKQWGEWKKYIDRDIEDPDWQQDYSRLKSSDSFAILNLEGGCGFHGERVHVMQRVGKKFAGAELDGLEYREFPEVRG